MQGSRTLLVVLLALVVAVVILGVAPILAVSFGGGNLSDALVASSDKAVGGLIGIAGTVAGLGFRQSRADETRAENTGKAFDAITATARAPTPSDGTLDLSPDMRV